MSESESSQGPTFSLQRVRCCHCQLPLIQVGEGNMLVTVHHQGKEITQPTPAYSYRTLTDPTPLQVCPRCGTILTSATTAPVPARTIVIEEGTPAPNPNRND
jgi:hypothetical protein